jgi:hypothetical protein
MNFRKLIIRLICFTTIVAAGPWALYAVAPVSAATRTPVNTVVDAGSDTFPLDIASAWTADRKALTEAVINPTESKQTLSLRIRGAELSGKGTLHRMVSSNLTATAAIGREPDVKIEEKHIDQIPTNPSFAPLNVNIYVFPVKQ